MPPPRTFRSRLGVHSEDGFPAEVMSPPTISAGGAGKSRVKGKRGHAFSAPALPDDGQRLALA